MGSLTRREGGEGVISETTAGKSPGRPTWGLLETGVGAATGMASGLLRAGTGERARGGCSRLQGTPLPAAAHSRWPGHIGCQAGAGGPLRGGCGVCSWAMLMGANGRTWAPSVSGNFREAEPNRTLDGRELDRRPQPHRRPVRPPGQGQHSCDRAEGIGCTQIVRKRGAHPALLLGGVSEGTWNRVLPEASPGMQRRRAETQRQLPSTVHQKERCAPPAAATRRAGCSGCPQGQAGVQKSATRQENRAFLTGVSGLCLNLRLAAGATPGLKEETAQVNPLGAVHRAGTLRCPHSRPQHSHRLASGNPTAREQKSCGRQSLASPRGPGRHPSGLTSQREPRRKATPP